MITSGLRGALARVATIWKIVLMVLIPSVLKSVNGENTNNNCDYLLTAAGNGENISYSTTLTTNNTQSCLATVNLVEKNNLYNNSNSNYTNSIINNQFYCEQDGYSYCTYLNISDIYCDGNDNEYGISTIKIGIYGEPLAGNEDLFTIFSYTTHTGNNSYYDKYFTLLNDWDTGVWVLAAANKGTGGAFIAPQCNSSSFLTTDINEGIFDLLGKGNLYNNGAIREDVAGGDAENYELLTDNELDDGPFYITLQLDRINGQTKVIFENNGINNNNNSSATCLYNDVFASGNIIVNMFLDHVDTVVAFDKFEVEYTCEIITVLAPTNDTNNTVQPTLTTSMQSNISTSSGSSSTAVPSQQPIYMDLSSVQPTLQPSDPSNMPSSEPSVEPSVVPSVVLTTVHPSTSVPSQQPTVQPSDEIVVVTTNASSNPSNMPSSEPTMEPSVVSTAMYTSSNVDLATIESSLQATSTLNHNTTVNSNISDIILLNNTAVNVNVNDTIGINASDVYNVVIIGDTSDNDKDNEKTPFMRKYILYILIACVSVVLLCILFIAICIYYRNYNNRKQQLQGSKTKSLNSSNATQNTSIHGHSGRGININSEKNVRIALEIVNYNVLNQTNDSNKGLATTRATRSARTGHEGESQAAGVEGAPDHSHKQQQVATQISLNNGNNIGDKDELSISSSGRNEDLYDSGIETKQS